MDAFQPPPDLATQVAEIVDRERRARRISQHVLAQKIGMSYRTLQRSLRGERAFAYEEMLAIAQAFGRDLDMYREAA